MKLAIFVTKLLHFTLASICIMFLGIIVSKNLNEIYPESESEPNKKKTGKLILFTMIFTALIYIFHYYIIFWNKSIGYDTNRLKELGGGIAMAFSMFLFMDKFKTDLKTLFNDRLNILIFNRNNKKINNKKMFKNY
jgi:predicted secreted protein